MCTGSRPSIPINLLIRNQGAFFAKDDGNILSCIMCKTRYCIVCEVPFHEEQTCDDYQADAKRRSEDEQKSLETVKQVSRPCPGPGCGVNIDKWTGCDHVTCESMEPIVHGRNVMLTAVTGRRCKHEFCWQCFAPYKGPTGTLRVGNSAHKDDCPHHSNRLPSYRPPVAY